MGTTTVTTSFDGSARASNAMRITGATYTTNGAADSTSTYGATDTGTWAIAAGSTTATANRIGNAATVTPNRATDTANEAGYNQMVGMGIFAKQYVSSPR